MLNRPTQMAAVVLQREDVDNRWETQRWELLAVVPDMGGDVRSIQVDRGLLHRLHPGFELVLYADEAEGYYLNASSEAPSVFVSIRTDEASGDVYPFQATLSYNEAARWMDGGEKVERALAWDELAAWMGQWVEDNYRPEPKRRQRPKSFEGKEGRLRKAGES